MMRRHEDHVDVDEGDFLKEVVVLVLWIVVVIAITAVPQ